MAKFEWMNNGNLNDFVKGVHPAMVVVIEPSHRDIMEDIDTLKSE